MQAISRGHGSTSSPARTGGSVRSDCAERRAEPRVEVPGVLLPEQLVAVLRAVRRRRVRRRGPQLRQRQQAVPDVRRHAARRPRDDAGSTCDRRRA